MSFKCWRRKNVLYYIEPAVGLVERFVSWGRGDNRFLTPGFLTGCIDDDREEENLSTLFFRLVVQSIGTGHEFSSFQLFRVFFFLNVIVGDLYLLTLAVQLERRVMRKETNYYFSLSHCAKKEDIDNVYLPIDTFPMTSAI